MEALMNEQSRPEMVSRNIQEARRDVFLRTAVGKDVATGDAGGARSDVSPNIEVPTAPFFGPRILRDIPLDEVFALLDLEELYRLQWGARGSGPKYQRTVAEEFEPTLERLKRAARTEGWIQPAAVYGYFPVQSRDNSLIIYDPAAYQSDGGALREIGRLDFPRQEGRDRLCLADYFGAADGDAVDVAAFQIVTVGDAATRQFEDLQAAGEYSEAFYRHGLSVESAEAVAEWMHRRVRRELGLADGRGKRYSWGYPACPDLEGHLTLFRLLGAESALGMSLTDAFQLIPEQSTAAIVVHHPEAKYYAVRGEQRSAAATQALPAASSASGQ
jgi:5-methyltetrahydrofolate--homocysteine methyltransferase